jgi:hypothetical protein
VGRRLLGLFAWLFIVLYGGISVGAFSVDACTVSEEGCDEDDCDPHGCPPICAGTSCCHASVHVGSEVVEVIAAAPMVLTASRPVAGQQRLSSGVCSGIFRPPRLA